MRKKIAIIGDGATGTAVFIALVRKLTNVDIFLIDPIEPARGKVFDQNNHDLLCNTSPDVMSLFIDKPYDFIDYLQERGIIYSPGYFAPRGLYSDYLFDRYQHYLQNAVHKEINVSYVPDHVACIEISGIDQYKIELNSGTDIEVNQVIIASGTGQELIPEPLEAYTEFPNFYATPYNLKNSTFDGNVSNVLVIGTKLSAIDAAILFQKSKCNITMISPSGSLPAVRTATPYPKQRFLQSSDFCKLDLSSKNIASLVCIVIAQKMKSMGWPPLEEQMSQANSISIRLAEEIWLAANGKNHWQDLIFDLADTTNEILTPLSNELKSHVLSSCEEKMSRHLGAFTLVNANKILHSIQKNRLQVFQGVVTEITFDKAWSVKFSCGESKYFDVIVCAAGYHKFNMYVHKNKLFLNKKPYTFCKSIIITDDLLVRIPERKHSENIWVVGAASGSKIPIVNAMYSSVKHAYFVAESILRSL